LATTEVRSALNNVKGKTCSYTAVSPFVQTASITISDVGQSGTMCSTLTGPTAADETLLKVTALLPISGVFPFSASFGAAAVQTCTQAGSAASLIPSLAILGMIAALM
jgi:hypothetical protein